jgi:hypothetical protein
MIPALRRNLLLNVIPIPASAGTSIMDFQMTPSMIEIIMMPMMENNGASAIRPAKIAIVTVKVSPFTGLLHPLVESVAVVTNGPGCVFGICKIQHLPT